MVFAADPSWIQIVAGPFEILSTGSTPDTQTAAQNLGQAYHAFRHILGELPSPAPPIRVLLFRTDREFESFRAGRLTRGFYQSSPERDYLVVPMASSQRSRVLRHELTHLFLNHISGPMPVWLEEGTAEFFSTLTVDEGSATVVRATVGSPIESHLALLRRAESWLPLAKLVRIGKHAPSYDGEEQNAMFYAQSWALVHMLQHGAGYRGKTTRLTEALSSGLSPEAAFEQTYSRPLTEIERELRRYIAESRFPVQQVELPPANPFEAKPKAAEIVDVYSALGDLLQTQGRQDAAAEWYQRLRDQLPDSPRKSEALGYLALQQKQDAEAVRWFRDALAKGGRNPSVAFELAMLQRDAGASDDDIRPLLQKAVQWNPAYAEAWLQLGGLEQRMGRESEAIEALRTAVRILPRQSSFWVALSRAYRAAGRHESAENAAQRALQAAVTENERNIAQGLTKESLPGATRAPQKEPVVQVPTSWEPVKADARKEGRLANVDCLAPVLTVVLTTDSGPLELTVPNPQRIRVNGVTAPSNFPCGAQKQRPVTVEFLTATKELVAIEFR